MKKRCVSFRLFIEFLLILPLVSRGALADTTVVNPPLTIITEEWPPLNYTEEGEIKGFATEVLRLVMKELNVNYNIIDLPGNRGLNVLNKGPRVLFYSFILTPERKSLYKWIGPFGAEAIYFYKRKGAKLRIKTLEDAKNVRGVCCRDAGLVYNHLKAAGFQNLDVGVDPTGIYLKVIHGRCDLAIGEAASGVAYWLKKANLAENLLEQTAVKVTDSPLYIAGSKDIPDEEITRWQRALEKVKMTPEYAKLYRSYRGSLK